MPVEPPAGYRPVRIADVCEVQPVVLLVLASLVLISCRTAS